MILDTKRLIDHEQAAIQGLEAYCTRIEQDPFTHFTVAQLREFYEYYRRTSAVLAVLQSSHIAQSTAGYLESLLGRAYGVIYGHESSGRKVRWFSWFFRDFPRVFRKHHRPFLFSLLITVLGCCFGVFLLTANPDLKKNILPYGHGNMDPASRVAREEAGRQAQNDPGTQAAFSAFLMQNNISVSIRAIVFGLTFGAGTLMMLFYNGVILGGICLDYIRAGQGTFLAGWLLPHGSIEIPAILIAGQIGFVIAGALTGRGGPTLRLRFRSIGPDIAVLFGSLSVMLVWAGIVEAFFSQFHYPVLPYWIKIVFGAGELAILFTFLYFGGKDASHSRT